MSRLLIDPGHACWCKSCQPGLLLPETARPVRDRHVALRFGTAWQETNPTWWVATYGGELVPHLLEAIPGDEDGAVQFFGEEPGSAGPHSCRTCRVHICTAVLTGRVRVYEIPMTLWERTASAYDAKVLAYIALAEESGLASRPRWTCTSCGNTAVLSFRVNTRDRGPQTLYSCASMAHQNRIKSYGQVLSVDSLGDEVVHRMVP